MKKIPILCCMAMVCVLAIYSCQKPQTQTPVDPFHYQRPVEPALGKTTLNCIVDSMWFGVGSETDDNEYLYIHDVDNDSVYQLEIDSHFEPSAICRVDSSDLTGVGTAFTLAPPASNFVIAGNDSVGLVLDLYRPNQRQLTIEVDSAWEDVYALGVKKIIATITPQTAITYIDENGNQSSEFIKTDTASHNAAINAVNYTFLNDFGQPQSYYYKPIDWTNSYSPCRVYILRPYDWHKE